MDIDKLIHNTIEIEGLLRVLREREDPEALALLKEHVAELQSSLDAIKPEEKADEADQAEADVPAADRAAGMPTVSTFDDEEVNQVEEANEVNGVNKAETDEVNVDHDVDEVNLTDEADEADDSEVADVSEVADDVDKVETAPEVTKAIPLPSEQDEPATLNDLARRRQTHDFAKSFSINDKFRYIREVFSGDTKSFEKAVGRISSLDSLDQAYDYLLNDIQLDPENESVGEFLAVVANHYNSCQ